MSRENVEIVRRWWASLEAGELPLDLTDENVRIDNIERPVVEGTFHGHDGLRRWSQAIQAACRSYNFTPQPPTRTLSRASNRAWTPGGTLPMQCCPASS